MNEMEFRNSTRQVMWEEDELDEEGRRIRDRERYRSIIEGKSEWNSPYSNIRNSNVRLVIDVDKYNSDKAIKDEPMKRFNHNWFSKHFEDFVPFIIIAVIALILTVIACGAKLSKENSANKNNVDNNKNFVVDENGIKFDTRY